MSSADAAAEVGGGWGNTEGHDSRVQGAAAEEVTHQDHREAVEEVAGEELSPLVLWMK